MGSSTRCWKNVVERAPGLLSAALCVCGALFLLGACSRAGAPAPGRLAVRAAVLSSSAGGSQLDLNLDCALSAPMEQALDHGIPLRLRVEVSAGRWPARRSVKSDLELRYFPLSRRYQLRQSDSDEERSFPTRGYLLAALETLRVPFGKDFSALPAGTPLHVAVAFDPTALPGALRLPALFEPAWRLAAPAYAWTAP